MPADILTHIQNEIHAFSKGQKKIASYILTNYDKAAFMTASRLGKTVGVSESTVVRFAVELGYEGYPEMQKTLQELVRNKLTSVQRIEVASDQFGNQDVVSSVLQRDANAIRMTSDALDRGQMARAVEAILAARHIYIVGNRYVSPDRLIVDGTPRLPGDPADSLIGSFVAAIAGERKQIGRATGRERA